MKDQNPAQAPSLPPTLLSVEWVADYLQLSERTVWSMVSAGQLPNPIKLGDRIRRWRRADLDAWVAGLPTSS